MEPIVIDALRMASIDGTYPELSQFMKNGPEESRQELEAMYTLLASLSVGGDMQRRLEDQTVAVYSSGAEQGFRDGFRVAVRLMTESLGVPEGPETGGKDDGL